MISYHMIFMIIYIYMIILFFPFWVIHIFLWGFVQKYLALQGIFPMPFYIWGKTNITMQLVGPSD